MLKGWVVRRIEAYQQRGGSQHHFRIDCNFHPTCSEYTKQAILRFGLWRGGLLGVSRIRRCNCPDCPTVVSDPVPETLDK